MTACDVIVLGGGAAGLYCAFTAGRRGRSVIVLDHAVKLGRKILISGGGRCNFTNRHATADNYLSANPHFCRSALARCTPDDIIALVDRHRIPWHEKTLGQLFCDDSAQRILGMLLAECAEAGVRIVTGCAVAEVERDAGGFALATSCGRFTAPRLVLATGGLSIPSIGATDLGYRIARRFGLGVIETAPALVPLTLPAHLGLGELSGLSVAAEVAAGGVCFRENVLFTHHGLSGPAILQASSYWRPGAPIVVDLLPDGAVADLLAAARAGGSQALTSTVLGERIPKRLVQHRLQALGADRPVRQLSPADIAAIADALHRWELLPTGTEGYRKAEVTRGGIDTDGLSSRTMESRRITGLHCIGEVVDVTGWLGGFNFQWAWASGQAAGEAV